MDSFSVSINLAKLKGAQMLDFVNQNGVPVKSIVIPIEANNIQCFDHHASAYLNMTTKPCADNPKYTHNLYPNIAHEKYELMTKEERDKQDFIGRMRPFSFKKNNK